MLADGIRLTSVTGGTGALTCSAQTGWASPANAFTGTRFIQYAITQYSSSAKTQLSLLETGIGSYVTGTNVLTRTKILSTWNGTTYLPNPGSATAPTALSFGTTSANIDVIIAPIAGLNGGIPFTAASGVNSTGPGVCANNIAQANNQFTSLTSGTVYYQAIELVYPAMYSQATIFTIGATAGGGAASTCNVAIYELLSTGLVGKRLIDFGNLGRLTATASYSTAALATPIFLPPGFYWQAILWVANSDTGNPQLRSGTPLMATPSGGCLLAGGNNNFVNPLPIASQTSLTDPATAPTGADTGVGSYAFCVWYK